MALFEVSLPEVRFAAGVGTVTRTSKGVAFWGETRYDKCMMNERIMTAYDAWSKANAAKAAFWNENVSNWTPEVDAVYSELNARSELLFAEYRAERLGTTVEKVTYAMNEAIHSARD